MMTHIFGDIATATRIESTAKTMSVSSTFTTVAQNAERPSEGSRRLDRSTLASLSPLWKKWLPRQIQEVAGLQSA